MSSDDAKAYRTNLINRRSVAWILEYGIVRLATLVLVVKVLPYAVLTWILPGVWMLVRDIKTTSWGKRLVGLDVVSTREGGGEADLQARLLRNAPLLIPFVPLIEFLVAYSGKDPAMQRLGDRIANTRIVDKSPEKLGQGSFSGQLIGALALIIGAEYLITAMLLS